ncbi:hypothetical protein M758_8G144900 [Ceratodon purpureus]|nr:hypothetical protein M758_8G144900 [Ceratodon purpureus]
MKRHHAKPRRIFNLPPPSSIKTPPTSTPSNTKPNTENHHLRIPAKTTKTLNSRLLHTPLYLSSLDHLHATQTTAATSNSTKLQSKKRFSTLQNFKFRYQTTSTAKTLPQPLLQRPPQPHTNHQLLVFLLHANPTPRTTTTKPLTSKASAQNHLHNSNRSTSSSTKRSQHHRILPLAPNPGPLH